MLFLSSILYKQHSVVSVPVHHLQVCVCTRYFYGCARRSILHIKRRDTVVT